MKFHCFKFKLVMLLFVLLNLFNFSSWGQKNMTGESKPKFEKPQLSDLKKKLTPEQYTCTQEGGTEQPFHNKYWDNKAEGIYVDVVSSQPLFSSLDKFDSGSGWPSFTKPLEAGGLIQKKDFKFGMQRIEVRSEIADSHLGHVFDDGPKEAGGQRFCINSAALNFIPVDKLKENNLGKFLFLFSEKKHWEIATLAGGCFWGVEELFRNQPGVIETRTGYTGGKNESPDYNIVKGGASGHAESVQILFDPKKIKYEEILVQFFKLHDPTTTNRQGNDIGTQYRSAIFFETEDQHKIAIKVKERVEKSGAWKKPVVTEITQAKKFWSAEDYHQKYLLKHPDGYTCHFMRKLEF